MAMLVYVVKYNETDIIGVGADVPLFVDVVPSRWVVQSLDRCCQSSLFTVYTLSLVSIIYNASSVLTLVYRTLHCGSCRPKFVLLLSTFEFDAILQKV